VRIFCHRVLRLKVRAVHVGRHGMMKPLGRVRGRNDMGG
jgi:hypothetical protein